MQEARDAQAARITAEREEARRRAAEARQVRWQHLDRARFGNEAKDCACVNRELQVEVMSRD